jgi:hypothetical protein
MLSRVPRCSEPDDVTRRIPTPLSSPNSEVAGCLVGRSSSSSPRAIPPLRGAPDVGLRMSCGGDGTGCAVSSAGITLIETGGGRTRPLRAEIGLDIVDSRSTSACVRRWECWIDVITEGRCVKLCCRIDARIRSRSESASRLQEPRTSSRSSGVNANSAAISTRTLHNNVFD